jgi:hypothetical protein
VKSIPSQTCDYEIELHFQDCNELPLAKRIDEKGRIVHIKEQGDFPIEKGIGVEQGMIIIEAGSLSLKVPEKVFETLVRQIC